MNIANFLRFISSPLNIRFPLLLCFALCLGCGAGGTSLAPRPMAARYLHTELKDESALRSVTAIAIVPVLDSDPYGRCLTLINAQSALAEALSNETTVRLVRSASQAEALLELQLLECRERKGSRIGASEPARISFALKLLDLKGRLIWGAEYSRTDQALSENLLNLPDTFAAGASWLNFSQLSSEGLRIAMRDFEQQRIGKLVK